VSLIGAHQGGEVCVCELTTAFSLTQPTISHHLKVLAFHSHYSSVIVDER
jgi:ArsR family transcriptional regulator